MDYMGPDVLCPQKGWSLTPPLETQLGNDTK